MARIDWVRHRLEEWGRWCQQSESGALGFPSQSAFARMGPSSGRNEAAVPTIALQASETNEAVKSLQLTQSHLYQAVTLTYEKGLPRHLVAKRMCRAESTISANLDAADRAIARWFDDKREQAIRRAAANLTRPRAGE
jgi:hypothetical protein